jgi:hypothetical protein
MKHTSFAARMLAQNKRQEAARWAWNFWVTRDLLYYQLYRESRKYYEGFLFALYLAECSGYDSLEAFERQLKKPIA